MLIKNITWFNENLEEVSGDIRVSQDVIVERGIGLLPKRKEDVVDFAGHFLHTGLTNSHDHLEMNLYPRLGTPPYNNYTEWSKDIYKPGESPLKEIEKTDIDYRLLWGGLKNLVSGVTTVVHHNPWNRILGKSSFPVNVPQISWAHSLAFEKKMPSQIDETKPFVIHAAEGIDDFAKNEIYKLDELGLLRKNTMIVHGISADLELLRSRGVSLVWCPSSNLYMFNRTVASLKGINVTLGTDSTLTGSPTLLDEMRVALETGISSKKEIIEMVSKPTEKADFFITKVKDLLTLQPKDINMVVVRGVIRLSDENLSTLKRTMHVQGTRKYTDINVQKLRSYFEKKIGDKILEKNPLWTMIT